MFQAGRKKVARVMPIIGVLLAALLIYLFFFNQGFELSTEIQATDAGLGVYLTNNSVHSIEAIQVNYLDAFGQQAFVQAIDLMPPGEQIFIPLAPEQVVDDFITLYATAQYHQPIIRSYPLEGLSFVRLQPSILAPRSIRLNDTVLISVEICNEGMALDSLTIRPRVVGNLQPLTPARTFALPKDECREAGFEFQGTQLGSNTIYFNVLALSYSEEISINVSVIEGAP